jgi:sensor histidine kinase regulating citrate/malate metabolism
VKEELDFLQADMDFKHNIEKSYHIDKHVPLINGVYVDFSNSLLEILENCLKAMLKTEKKELIVTVGSTDTFIEVKFHDTGSGIEPEKKKQLLQILQDPSSVSLMESDLGISRVARLLKPYKAQFDIQSKPGDTTFTIKIPL